jgi:hypothetical protein
MRHENTQVDDLLGDWLDAGSEEEGGNKMIPSDIP